MGRKYFETPEGSIYSVSDRAMLLGFEPDPTHIEVDEPQDKTPNVINTTRLAELKKSLSLPAHIVEGLESRIEDQKQIEAAKKAEELAIKAAKRAEKRAIAQKAKEDQELAKKHAEAQAEYNKRQAEIEAIKKERAAADRLAEIEARRLEEARINEEIENSRAMREAHAELNAMHGRDRAKARREQRDG